MDSFSSFGSLGLLICMVLHVNMALMPGFRDRLSQSVSVLECTLPHPHLCHRYSFLLLWGLGSPNSSSSKGRNARGVHLKCYTLILTSEFIQFWISAEPWQKRAEPTVHTRYCVW